MSVRVVLNGLTELIQALTDAPEAMRAEARGIVRETTESAAREIAQAYPEVTGVLRRRVKTEYPSSDIVVGRVRSSAPHSHLYEFGTGPRRNGAGANRGRMPTPSSPITPRIARRHRDEMFGQLVRLVERAGFTVKR